MALRGVVAGLVVFLAAGCVDDHPRKSAETETNITFLSCDSQEASVVEVVSWDRDTRVLRLGINGAPLGSVARFVVEEQMDAMTVFYLPIERQPCEDPFSTRFEIDVLDVPLSLGDGFLINVTLAASARTPDFSNVLRVDLPVGGGN